MEMDGDWLSYHGLHAFARQRPRETPLHCGTERHLCLFAKLVIYSSSHFRLSWHIANALPPPSPRSNFFFDLLYSLVDISCWITWQAHQWMLGLFSRLQRVLIPLDELLDEPWFSRGGEKGH